MSRLEHVKRTLIFALVLTLLGLGPVPLSACAGVFSKLTECAAPMTRAHCDQMNMGESGIQLIAASDTSCCIVPTVHTPISVQSARFFLGSMHHGP